MCQEELEHQLAQAKEIIERLTAMLHVYDRTGSDYDQDDYNFIRTANNFITDEPADKSYDITQLQPEDDLPF